MANAMLKRGAMVGAAAAVAVGFASAPAAAANVDIRLPSDRGLMTYIDNGDRFTVCDTKADGYGVTGYVRKLRTDGKIITVKTIDDGGDAGCDSATVDLIGTWPHDMMLCWHGGGTCVISPVIRES
ncbi:hypothetical protein ACFVDU_02980 [Streptomyces albidoflavus]|uniref:Uncharacterized protein n=1 Tax=Streptomyces koyangensis TaxID=188770 RepID=A0A385DE46_9ACTN|nr:hypothetical protein [Streptomyces koyangensis]AXQ56723.1 hypothetical protein D0C37_20405 [Streptomyces koyangensis]